MAGERKQAFIREIVRDVQALALLGKKWADQDNEYFDNGYNGGAADPIVDADVASADITAADFTNAITLMQNFEKLRTNQVPTTADYADTLNAILRATV